jgi:mRNA interferase MazF
MPFDRGAVVLAPFPDADGKNYKKRPALVVQSDSLITDYAQRVVAEITSKRRVGASRVQVPSASPEGRAMGLPMDSSLVMDRLATLGDAEIIKTIGKCPPQTMLLVDEALRRVFDL